MMEMREDMNDYEMRTYKEEKPVSHLGECAVLT
jgi:hypothetical protein